MPMTNTKLLSEEIRKNGYTMESLANEIGLSRTGLFNKMHNITEFRISEINKISTVLNLKKRDMNRIFFATDVE